MNNTGKTQRDLFEQLLRTIENEEVPFYRKAANKNYVSWHSLVALSIILSTAASLIAALTPPEELKQAWTRGLLISLPIVGAMVTAFLKSFSFHERERNREIGLINMERLLRKARSVFAGAKSEDDYRNGYLELNDELAKISHDQHQLDVETRRGAKN